MTWPFSWNKLDRLRTQGPDKDSGRAPRPKRRKPIRLAGLYILPAFAPAFLDRERFVVVVPHFYLGAIVSPWVASPHGAFIRLGRKHLQLIKQALAEIYLE